MIAIEISSAGGPDVLLPAERAVPQPQAGEVLIRVRAAGVARADMLQRQGKYPPPSGASDIPGLDVAGTVEAVGEGVSSLEVGDAVCAILTGGGYAEFCTAPVEQVLPRPENWSFIEAATLPENLFTVYDNLVTRAGLVQGETVLIHGGTSGIGSMALMVSRQVGAVPFATAGSDSKAEACVRFGAEHAINYKDSDFVTEIKRLTANRGVDVVLDMVGGPYLDRNLEVLGHEGRISIVATQGGRQGHLDIGKLMGKRARVMGSTMRARSKEEKGKVARRLVEAVWASLPGKRWIKPVIDSTFPLRDARLAHERMESGEHIGKIVLTT
ncbi:MAG: NAD(P)H-quinone oxidoreductase [Bryobacteraceae bacterium]